MSVTIMARVLWTTIPKLQLSDKNKRSCENTSAKLTLVAIADSADDFGENSYNSFETLAIKSGLERRSVIRVIQALIFNEYISLSGISRYGTNNYSINLDKLGNPPSKRSRIGRPETSDPGALAQKSAVPASDPGAETSDPGAETSDPGAETSDPGSPDPSLTVLNPSLPGRANSSGQINPNSGRRTDAIVKGNAFDGMLYFAGAAAARAEDLGVTIEMLDRINEFPEDVRDTLRVISQLCVWLPAAIPSVRKKSEHEQWVNELRDVNAQLSGTGEEGLKAAHKVFKDWTVSHPSAIIKAVKSEAGKVAKRQSVNKEIEFTGIDTPYARMLDNPPVYTPEHEQMLADFRKKLRSRVSDSKNLNH